MGEKTTNVAIIFVKRLFPKNFSRAAAILRSSCNKSLRKKAISGKTQHVHILFHSKWIPLRMSIFKNFAWALGVSTDPAHSCPFHISTLHVYFQNMAPRFTQAARQSKVDASFLAHFSKTFLQIGKTNICKILFQLHIGKKKKNSPRSNICKINICKILRQCSLKLYNTRMKLLQNIISISHWNQCNIEIIAKYYFHHT